MVTVGDAELTRAVEADSDNRRPDTMIRAAAWLLQGSVIHQITIDDVISVLQRYLLEQN